MRFASVLAYRPPHRAAVVERDERRPEVQRLRVPGTSAAREAGAAAASAQRGRTVAFYAR